MTKTMTDIVRFEVGKRYGARFISEDDSRVEVTITRRTAATVWTDTGKMHRVRIWWSACGANKREVISPLGRYFGSPMITATDLVKQEALKPESGSA